MESRINPFISNNGAVALIGQLSSGREGNLFQPGGENYCCSFSPDETSYAWSSGFGKVVVVPWNHNKNCLISDSNTDDTGNLISSERISIECHFSVTSLAFGAGTPNANQPTLIDFSKALLLATGHNNGRIGIWDPYTGKLITPLTDHRSSVTCLSFSPDGSFHLASGSEDGTIKIWEFQDRGPNMFKTLADSPRCPVKDLAWSPDAQLICSVGRRQKAYLWDMKTYRLKMRLTGHFNDVLSCCFSPDGSLVATASCDTRVIIWSTETGDILKTFGHVNPPPGIIYMAGSNDYHVRGVAFSPNGLRVISICSDGYLRFWNLLSDDEEPVFSVKCMQNDPLLSCSFTPSGKAVAVSYASGSVDFYLVPPKMSNLKHISRVAFLKAMGSDLKTDNLDIPRKLIQYLQYKIW